MTDAAGYYDAVIVGGGHNGLTAAAYLARAGRSVLLLEAADQVGGAAVSARVFPGVPANLSRYSYLVSLLPQQICADLGLDIRLADRRYGSCTPAPGNPGAALLIDDQDPDATAASVAAATGARRDAAALGEFYASMERVAQQLFPTMLEPLRSCDDIRAMVGDDPLWEELTRRPIGEALESRFDSDLVRGLVATDALIGTFADLHSRGLRQNICLLYHLIGRRTGKWLVPVGGMGAVTAALAAAASAAGATLRTGTRVSAIDPSDGTVSWDGGSARGGFVLAGCAPVVFNALLAAAGAEPIPTEPDPEGAQLKVNLLVDRLPRLHAAVDPDAAFSGTLHVNESMSQLQTAYRQAAAGEVPDLPPCELYCHTLSDRSILDEPLRSSSAQTLTLFGLQMPARLFVGDPERHDRVKQAALEATLTSLNSVLAEPIESVIARDSNGAACIEARTPREIEASVGMPGGNIFHRSLQWPWADSDAQVGTWGVETQYPRVLICGAGARRGGGVSGIPGHNAARAILAPG